MIKPSQYKKMLKKGQKLPFKPSFKNVRTFVFGRMTLTTGQETALDAIWSRAVKAKAGNRCEYCHKTEGLEAHHVIGRRNKTLRHVVSNGFSLCHTHHRFAEQNGIAFAVWAINKRGQKWWDDLEAYGREVKVWKDYTVIKAYLESFLEYERTV